MEPPALGESTAVVVNVEGIADEGMDDTALPAAPPPAPPAGGTTTALPPQSVKTRDIAKTPPKQTSRRQGAMVSPLAAFHARVLDAGALASSVALHKRTPRVDKIVAAGEPEPRWNRGTRTMLTRAIRERVREPWWLGHLGQ